MRTAIRTLVITALFIGVFSAQAQDDPKALRAKAKELHNKARSMQNEAKTLQNEARTLEAKAKTIELLPKIEEAVSKMKAAKPKKKRHILIYSRTTGFRHSSIPMSVEVLKVLGEKTGAFTAEATEDPKIFTSQDLDRFDGIIMLSTTGEPIPKGEGQEKFEAWLAKGKGLIGIHAATDCHKNWKGYREAMGGIFAGHPWSARHLVSLYNEEPDHPICKHIKTGDQIKDEIYQYQDDEYFTREKLRILLSLDLSGPKMKAGGMKRKDNDYAVSWIREYTGSKVFYSNLGHNESTFLNPMSLQHFLNGIQFALGDIKADARPSAEVGKGTARPLPESWK